MRPVLNYFPFGVFRIKKENEYFPWKQTPAVRILINLLLFIYWGVGDTPFVGQTLWNGDSPTRALCYPKSQKTNSEMLKNYSICGRQLYWFFFLIKQVEAFSTFNIGCNDSDMVEKEWQ